MLPTVPLKGNTRLVYYINYSGCLCVHAVIFYSSFLYNHLTVLTNTIFMFIKFCPKSLHFLNLSNGATTVQCQWYIQGQIQKLGGGGTTYVTVLGSQSFKGGRASPKDVL